jgi:NADH dehydrogenase FAD-containing subunit
MSYSNKPRVIIVGGGFAGMACARALANAGVEIKLIDRRNFHLFQPLLYQVASGGLSPANIAAPLRSVFRRQRNVQVLMNGVDGFDVAAQEVLLEDSSRLPYDYLVVATGSTHHYFGKDAQWEPLAPGLKTIEDATRIRRMLLTAFEEAEREEDESQRVSLLTFVIVGGGPTGVEMAGAICELARYTLKNEFRSINPASARIILVESSEEILDRYHPDLYRYAKRALLELGAEVCCNARVEEIHPDHVVIKQSGTPKRIDTRNVIWAAGVKASGLAKKMAEAIGNEAIIDRGGRIATDGMCAVLGAKNVFAAGDMAAFPLEDGKTLPGVAPVAMQQGYYIGSRIAKLVAGETPDQPFKYWDKGNMATIGRSRAVLESGKWRMTGWFAWLAWLFIHILYLARFENRMLVLFQWFWGYITRNRTARLITGSELEPDPTSNSAPLLGWLALFGAAAMASGGMAQDVQSIHHPPAPTIEVHETKVISWKPPLYHGWPTLTQRKDGELLLAFSGGREAHVCPFGRLEWMRSKDGGKTWGWPQVLLDSPIDDRDAGVVETAAGTILVTHFTSLAFEPILERAERTPVGQPGGFTEAKLIDEWRAARDRLSSDQRQSELGCYMIRSTDGGVTWSERYRVPVNSPHGPIVTRDGRLLYAGKSLWDGGKLGFFESVDDGRTWNPLADLPTRAGDNADLYHELHAVSGSDGLLICHIRNGNKSHQGETLQSESCDSGRTWSIPHSIDVWGLPSHLLRLADGRLLMTYGYRRAPYGIQARISADSGQTWSEPIVLSADGIGGDLGYPSTIERFDGTLVTVWYEVLQGSPLAQLRQASWKMLPGPANRVD